MPAETILSLRNVDHFYGTGALRRQILFDISMDVSAGEIVLLTGPSGSGKTTLLTLAGALRTVQQGSVQALGQELNNASNAERMKVRGGIGFVFQHQNLLQSQTAIQNVELSLGIGESLPRDVVRRRCVQALETVGLGRHLDHYPEELSGGQKQRVAIARALVRRPKMILADEPTASLDRKSGREVVELMQALVRQQNCAILMVTHDNRILDIADRIVTLEDGKLISLSSSLAMNTGNILQGFTRLQRSGELLHHVDALSTKQFLELLEHVTAEFRQYIQVFKIGGRDAASELFDSVLKATVVKTIHVMRADRGTIYFVDRTAGLLRSRIATGEGDTMISISAPIANSLAGQVVLQKQTLNIRNAYESSFFNPAMDQATGYRTGSMLCTPLLTSAGEIFAVAQWIRPQNQEPFTLEDEHQFSAFSEPLGVILENCLELQGQLG